MRPAEARGLLRSVQEARNTVAMFEGLFLAAMGYVLSTEALKANPKGPRLYVIPEWSAWYGRPDSSYFGGKKVVIHELAMRDATDKLNGTGAYAKEST